VFLLAGEKCLSWHQDPPDVLQLGFSSHSSEYLSSMIKSVGDLISTQKNSLRTLCVILEGFAHIFFANCCVCVTDHCM
jgi:hypothetical protein